MCVKNIKTCNNGYIFEICRVCSDTAYLAIKTEKRKHCSKIFFKCLNSAVGPIFHIFLNNVVAGPVYGALFLLYNESMSMNSAVTVHMREKKNGNAKLKTQMHNNPIQTGTYSC